MDTLFEFEMTIAAPTANGDEHDPALRACRVDRSLNGGSAIGLAAGRSSKVNNIEDALCLRLRKDRGSRDLSWNAHAQCQARKETQQVEVSHTFK